MALQLKTAPAVEPISLAEAKMHLRVDSTTFGDGLDAVQSIAPGSHNVAASYSLKGTAVDVLGYSALVVLEAGTCGSGGTVDAKIQHSDTNSDTAFVDWSGGAFTQVTTANDNATQEIAYTGTKRYLRVVATVADAACEFGATVIRGAAASPEDSLIEALITAAREYCEGYQNRAYITQTWYLWLDAWPSGNSITIPLPPLQSVTAVTYYDTTGTETTMSASDYIVDEVGGRLVLADGCSWPSTTLRPVNGLCIEYVCGYGDEPSDVPQRVRQAMLLLLAHWYENREAVLTGGPGSGVAATELPLAVDALLWQERVVPA